MNCLVLMPFIFSLFLLDSSLYIASRSSLSQCHLAHEFTVTSYFFKSIMQISGSPLTPMYFSQLISHSSYRVFYSNKGSNFLSSSPYLFSYNSLYFLSFKPKSPLLSKLILGFTGYKKHLLIKFTLLKLWYFILS